VQALAAGTPVLTTDLPNLCDSLVENGAGATFRRGDSTNLAEAAQELLTDDDQRLQMGRRARALYERQHTLEGAVAALEAIYRSVMAAPPTPGQPSAGASRTG
ncbi:MAG TPA: glycosyltransferase, partial [Actinomycetes bacterium]|nr:glycosyltransferase [Actinomycetes bacterium]